MAGKSSKRGTRREAQQEETQPAEERGERLATGRAIARGGEGTADVAGATEQTPAEPPSGVVMPPAPPGESAHEAVQKTRAVADAMIELGENADPKQVAEVIKAKTGVVLESSEVATIQATLREHAKIPPGPDQPPPEDARRNPSVALSEGQPMDTSTKEPRQERLRETALLRSTADRKQLPLKECQMKCDVCGNDYDKAFTVTMAGQTHTFDCFECAVHALAPACAHCGCKVIGHGVEQDGTFFCCAHCAKHEGVAGIKDRA